MCLLRIKAAAGEETNTNPKPPGGANRRCLGASCDYRQKNGAHFGQETKNYQRWRETIDKDKTACYYGSEKAGNVTGNDFGYAEIAYGA